MIEKGFEGNKSYFIWLGLLVATILVALGFYAVQLREGLSITGMSRDISWGFYIANFTYFVGVAASAVMLVIPYYLHGYKKFGQIIIFGEWLAVGAVAMCMLFIMADMGQPQRFMNIFLHPTFNSVMFWDANVLLGYFLLNIIIAWNSVKAIRTGLPLPKWIKPLVFLSIPWAIGIHTVTAFLYSGLPGRHLWLTAIMAPRFLASAFASGPSFFLILIFLLEKFTRFRVEPEAKHTLGKIILYAMITNVFFYAMEFFTAFYSNIPSHKHSLEYLFFGLEGYHKLVPWSWTSIILGFTGIFMLGLQTAKPERKTLTIAALMIFISTYIDKGITLIIGGFIPSPLDHITEYSVTAAEFIISAGIWAIGALIITVTYKMTTGVIEEKGQ